MLSIDDITKYLQLRAKGFSPSWALRTIRAGDEPDPRDNLEEVRDGLWSYEPEALPDGWHCRVAIEADEYPDTSWLGKFTSVAVDVDVIDGYVKHDRREGTAGELPTFESGITYREHRDGLSRMGYSKGNADLLAKRYVLQDYRRMLDYGCGWLSYLFTVTLHDAAGNVVAEDCCGGLGSDDRDEYPLRAALEAADNLIDDAAAEEFASVPQL